MLLIGYLVIDSTDGASFIADLKWKGSGLLSLSEKNWILFSSNRPKPRRRLKKRRKQQIDQEDDFPWETAESRPMVQSRRIETGEDYWIDENDLQKSIAYNEAVKNRKAMEGEISKEKLRTEVVAPYTQNWIGLFSVFIIVLAVIIKQFPELLQSPSIPFPDL